MVTSLSITGFCRHHVVAIVDESQLVHVYVVASFSMSFQSELYVLAVEQFVKLHVVFFPSFIFCSECYWVSESLELSAVLANSIVR